MIQWCNRYVEPFDDGLTIYTVWTTFSEGIDIKKPLQLHWLNSNPNFIGKKKNCTSLSISMSLQEISGKPCFDPWLFTGNSLIPWEFQWDAPLQRTRDEGQIHIHTLNASRSQGCYEEGDETWLRPGEISRGHWPEVCPAWVAAHIQYHLAYHWWRFRMQKSYNICIALYIYIYVYIYIST